MSEIALAVYEPLASMTEAERDLLRTTLFGRVDGVDEPNKKSWRRFWNRVRKLEVGECFFIDTHTVRSGPFHRRHMALEQAVFESQERFTDFDQFRVWLKIGAGHCDWLPGPRGAIIPVPRSIAYGKLDEDQMQAFHVKLVAFLREARPLAVLWPHLDHKRREEMIETVLADFDEW